MQYFELSLDNWRRLEHFRGNRSLHDTKMLTELVCYDERERLAPIAVDETDPKAFECMVLTTISRNKLLHECFFFFHLLNFVMLWPFLLCHKVTYHKFLCF